MTTAALLAYTLGLLAAGIALWAYALLIGLRWVGQNDSTLLGCLKFSIVVQVVITAGLLGLMAATGLSPGVLLASSILVAVALPILAVARTYGLSMPKAAAAWFPTLLSSLLLLGLSSFVTKPYFVEFYSMPTNSMAPTVLGRCEVRACPECGAPAYCCPKEDTRPTPLDRVAICEQFHTAGAATIPTSERSGDCIVVFKTLRPRRWDLVAFRSPPNEGTIFIKRLVGMPGETVTIVEGQVHADGEALTPPDHLRGLEYVTTFPGGHQAPWGTPESPAVLGEDEYFVLGDFSTMSLDSRFGQQGAPGREPYALPASNLVGVTTHIYWPPDRWRCFR